MVLVSELGWVGGFAYATWQVVGQWYRFRSKTNQRLDDTALFAALEEAVAAAKADKKAQRTDDFGAAAKASGHGHLFDDWKRLPLQLRAQFADDLADLALWSGQGKTIKVCQAYRSDEAGAQQPLAFTFMLCICMHHHPCIHATMRPLRAWSSYARSCPLCPAELCVSAQAHQRIMARRSWAYCTFGFPKRMLHSTVEATAPAHCICSRHRLLAPRKIAPGRNADCAIQSTCSVTLL